MDNCPECGIDRDLVGLRHRCVAKAPSLTGVVPSKSYQYRDPVKRRLQVAEAMRRYRARKHAI